MPSLRASLGKSHLRVIAVDDGAFTRRQRWAPLVAVAYSLPSTLEGVSLDWVRVDGRDATDRVFALLRGSPYLAGARAVLVDGVALAGFNLLDVRRLAERLRRPVVTVTRRRPNFPRIEAALRKYFPAEFRRRWHLARSVRLFEVPTAGEPILAGAVGCRSADARTLVQRATIRGFWPEPLRVAHAIGHAVGSSTRPTPDVRS